MSAARRQSDDYFEGGYVVIWKFYSRRRHLDLLMHSRIPRGLRDFPATTGSKTLQVILRHPLVIIT